MKTIIFIIFLSMTFLISLNSYVDGLSTKPSNESINAEEKIMQAGICLEEMQERIIPITRANESYQEAMQLYEAQTSLEKQGRKAEYDIVVRYAEDVCNVKKISFGAQDELIVFLEAFKKANNSINISSMLYENGEKNGLYFQILSSFEEERFEKTPELIKQGHNKISELEASQTTLKLFYATTKRTIKDFFIENWKKLSITFGGLAFFLLVFWRTLKKIRIGYKLRSLLIQRKTLNDLIGKAQKEYFDIKQMSETEYRVKIEKFKEMIRDIDRQIPLLKEEMMKVEKTLVKKLEEGGGLKLLRQTGEKGKIKKLPKVFKKRIKKEK